MHKIGDTVVYGARGVCEIKDITNTMVLGKVSQYYILMPKFDGNMTISVPADNAELVQKMREVKSATEINEIISSLPDVDGEWIENENVRAKTYQDIIIGGKADELASLIRTLYVHREEVVAAGKKPHKSDETFLKDAKKLLYDEFAVGLGIERDEVEEYILSRM